MARPLRWPQVIHYEVCDDLASVIIRDTPWKAMLGRDERDATTEEIAVLEAEYGPFLLADGEG